MTTEIRQIVRPLDPQAVVEAHVKATTGVHGVGASEVESKAGAQEKVDAHAGRTDNPHQVTAAQVGAETPDGAQAKADSKFISARADSVDWNTLTTPGTNILNRGEALNGPGPAIYFYCVVWRYTATRLTQLAIPYATGVPSGSIYMRGLYDGVWTSWQKFWHAGNDGAASGLDADMVDGMHASALGPNWVQPGDTVLLSAPTERSRSDPDYAACKRLQVVRPGRYRITGEARISNGSGTAYINICAVALGGYEAAGNAVDVGSWSTNSTTYVAFAIDMSAAVPELGVIVVEIRSSSTSYTAYIRNVQVKYADGGSAPSPAVLQN